MSLYEMSTLWLATRPRDQDRAYPINYAEQFVQRWFDLRSGSHTRDIIMGGMVTILARTLVPDFDPNQVDVISTDILLDEHMLVSIFRWMRPHGRYLDCEFTWFVGSGDPYITLPHLALTGIENSQLPNPFKFPRSLGVVEEPPQPLQPPPPPAQDPPHMDPGPSSSSSTISLKSLSKQIKKMQKQIDEHQRRQVAESDHMMTYLRGIYASQVEAGHIRSPYLNYPYHPPQQGPLPGWHGGQPTYPYWPPRPEGIDYRFPGGSDPTYDPNWPPFDTYPVYPPDYHESVPRMEDTWGGCTPPRWGQLADWETRPPSHAGADAGPSSSTFEEGGPSSHMDED